MNLTWCLGSRKLCILHPLEEDDETKVCPHTTSTYGWKFRLKILSRHQTDIRMKNLISSCAYNLPPIWSSFCKALDIRKFFMRKLGPWFSHTEENLVTGTLHVTRGHRWSFLWSQLFCNFLHATPSQKRTCQKIPQQPWWDCCTLSPDTFWETCWKGILHAPRRRRQYLR